MSTPGTEYMIPGGKNRSVRRKGRSRLENLSRSRRFTKTIREVLGGLDRRLTWKRPSGGGGDLDQPCGTPVHIGITAGREESLGSLGSQKKEEEKTKTKRKSQGRSLGGIWGKEKNPPD